MLFWKRSLLLFGVMMSLCNAGIAEPQSDRRPLDVLGKLVTEGGPYVTTMVNGTGQGGLAALLLAAAGVLTALYGFGMGWPAGVRQGLASAAKTPAMFLMTLGVCLPAMLVSAALTGVALEPVRLFNLLLLALTLNGVLLASLAPIAAFFGLGSGYHFLKLLHVGLFAISGLYSMHVLHDGLAGLAATQPAAAAAAGRLFMLWFVVYAFVGSQMAWLLRPFIGSPGLPFEFLRRREGELNFYSAVLLSAKRVLAGRDS